MMMGGVSAGTNNVRMECLFYALKQPYNPTTIDGLDWLLPTQRSQSIFWFGYPKPDSREIQLPSAVLDDRPLSGKLFSVIDFAK